MALLCPWTAFAQNSPPASCSTTSQNLWVRDQLNTYYYWYQFLPANVNPAIIHVAGSVPRSRALSGRSTTPISYITSAAANDAFYSDSQFIGYGFGNQTTSTEIRVLQVYDDSPALEAGLQRGDRIITVNGQTVSRRWWRTARIGSAFGADGNRRGHRRSTS